MRQEFDSPTPHKSFKMETKLNLTSKIPKEVSYVTNTLEKAGFEAYLVGGCVRDPLIRQSASWWTKRLGCNDKC